MSYSIDWWKWQILWRFEHWETTKRGDLTIFCSKLLSSYRISCLPALWIYNDMCEGVDPTFLIQVAGDSPGICQCHRLRIGVVHNKPSKPDVYIYIYESWAKGPWKGFPLRKPLGMQLTVSAKFFSEMAKVFFFWRKFWRKFMYSCLNCIVDICT